MRCTDLYNHPTIICIDMFSVKFADKRLDVRPRGRLFRAAHTPSCLVPALFLQHRLVACSSCCRLSLRACPQCEFRFIVYSNGRVNMAKCRFPGKSLKNVGGNRRRIRSTALKYVPDASVTAAENIQRGFVYFYTIFGASDDEVRHDHKSQGFDSSIPAKECWL